MSDPVEVETESTPTEAAVEEAIRRGQTIKERVASGAVGLRGEVRTAALAEAAESAAAARPDYGWEAMCYEPLKFDLGDSPPPPPEAETPTEAYWREVAGYLEDVTEVLAPGPDTDPDEAVITARRLARSLVSASPLVTYPEGCMCVLNSSPRNFVDLGGVAPGDRPSWRQVLREMAISAMTDDVVGPVMYRVVCAWGTLARAIREARWGPEAWETEPPVPGTGRLLVRIPMGRTRAVLRTPQGYGGPCRAGRLMLREWAGPAGLTVEGMQQVVAHFRALPAGQVHLEFGEPEVTWFIRHLCPPNTVGELTATLQREGPAIAERAMGEGERPDVRNVVGPDCVKALLEVADFEFYEEETEEAK